MQPFVINGDVWRPVLVGASDSRLIDRTGRFCVATTDPQTHCVYISNELKGEFLQRVLTHEVGHCALYSYGLLDSLHQIVPESRWVEAEEWACNFVADYGREILQAVRTAMAVPVVRRLYA